MSVVALGRPVTDAEAGRRQAPSASRLIMVPPDQVPDGARVVAVVALVPGQPAVHAVPRRATADPQEPAPDRAIGAGLLLDLDGRRVTADGRLLDLTRREFDLLAELATRPGRVLTRAQLLAAVWSPADAACTGPRTVDVHVARLRRKLGPHAAPLSTLRGVGYRWSRVPRLPASSAGVETP
jgi:DNA-binding winged helix-turn-helix (wHTH) protein